MLEAEFILEAWKISYCVCPINLVRICVTWPLREGFSVMNKACNLDCVHENDLDPTRETQPGWSGLSWSLLHGLPYYTLRSVVLWDCFSGKTAARCSTNSHTDTQPHHVTLQKQRPAKGSGVYQGRITWPHRHSVLITQSAIRLLTYSLIHSTSIVIGSLFNSSLSHSHPVHYVFRRQHFSTYLINVYSFHFTTTFSHSGHHLVGNVILLRYLSVIIPLHCSV
jgi:hypothetical protein